MSEEATTNNNGNSSHGEGKQSILVVFDLDYTIWEPEMYQLWGQPKFITTSKSVFKKKELLVETKTTKPGHVLADNNGSVMRVFPGASFALREINRLREDEGLDIRAAIASKTDEPTYAKFCMTHLVIDEDKGTTLADCFDSRLVEISYGDKTNHFQRLHHKTDIPYGQMIFFDNERWNITSVSKLGVKCFYTPNGMDTNQHWINARKLFDL